jgi:hypothetical protein
MITIGPVRTGASFGLGRSRMAGLQGRRCHRPACEQLAGTTTTPNVRAAGIAMSGWLDRQRDDPTPGAARPPRPRSFGSI